MIIVDAIMGEKDDDDDGLDFVRWTLDMIMMAHANRGKERTLKEWDYVLTKAGFSRYNVKHIAAIPSLIEAFP